MYAAYTHGCTFSLRFWFFSFGTWNCKAWISVSDRYCWPHLKILSSMVRNPAGCDSHVPARFHRKIIQNEVAFCRDIRPASHSHFASFPRHTYTDEWWECARSLVGAQSAIESQSIQIAIEEHNLHQICFKTLMSAKSKATDKKLHCGPTTCSG